MSEQAGAGAPTGKVQRRSLMKGTAWAAPAIAIAAAAPMAAASAIPERGLNGWVQLSRDCNWWAVDEFVIDGSGSYPNRGLWVFTTADDEPTSARITFWLPSTNFTFTNSSGTGWSNLARDEARDSDTPAAGYFAYTATYNGSWTWVDPGGTANDRWEAASDPQWRENDIPGGCSRVCAYATRTVIYTPGSDEVSFTRGPVCV